MSLTNTRCCRSGPHACRRRCVHGGLFDLHALPGLTAAESSRFSCASPSHTEACRASVDAAHERRLRRAVGAVRLSCRSACRRAQTPSGCTPFLWPRPSCSCRRSVKPRRTTTRPVPASLQTWATDGSVARLGGVWRVTVGISDAIPAGALSYKTYEHVLGVKHGCAKLLHALFQTLALVRLPRCAIAHPAARRCSP